MDNLFWTVQRLKRQLMNFNAEAVDGYPHYTMNKEIIHLMF